jgi:nitronate monooxygenase
MAETTSPPAPIEASILPPIIQGGMGAAISSWPLARAVAKLGQLGVVSGVALDLLLVRRLQDGDPGGHCRRALAAFPFPAMAQRVLDQFFRPEGRLPDEPYKPISMINHNGPIEAIERCIVGNFVEVWLAMEEETGPIGINYLEKIQTPHLASVYGAMLAGVTCILMGAGIPREIPGVLNRFVRHESAAYTLKVVGASCAEMVQMTFDPRFFMERDLPPLRRPAFLPIVASNVLATTLARKSTGTIDGFIIEGPTAGGHNAPPRGTMALSASEEPIYGKRDIVDLEAIRALGLPFWIGGGMARPEKLRAALAAGARGIQVGTAFALCDESGLEPRYRKQILDLVRRREARVFTDPVASPTGFPFKVALVPGTMSDPDRYAERTRVCDLGYLREAYRRADGSTGFRCPAEPVEAFVAKEGDQRETLGRKCLCNALMANIGMGQVRSNGYRELPLITCGDDLAEIDRFLQPDRPGYTAKDVIDSLLPGLA